MNKILSIEDMLPDKFQLTCTSKNSWILQFHELDAFIVKLRSYDIAKKQFVITLYNSINERGAQHVMQLIRQSYEHTDIPCAKLSLKKLDPVGEIIETHDFHLACITDAKFHDLDTTDIDLTFFYESVKVKK